MKLEKEMAILEALLFLENEAVDSKTLSRLSGIPLQAVEQILVQIKEHFDLEQHGIELVQLGSGYTFAPKKDLWENLKDRYGKKNEQKLSKASMETLSIIAYSQPVTRPEIDSIRGVSSDGSIKMLLMRNLVQEVGKKDAPGRPIQYGTTREFLKVFRLTSISELPKLGDIERERFELN